ncbi:MAG: LacI family DNA-binding transcriptional regulator [Candidatus Firestonebacteria bacterium]|nr:LacI family DNA-binding transcriptional regulator [Candidatus Firestonebacteria bacterium]
MAKIKITRELVAQKAKVAPSTVSRALSGHPGIPKRTADKVKKIAEALGYIPSSLGRSHFQKKSFRIGCVIPYKFDQRIQTLPSDYFSKFLYGLMLSAMEKNYSVTVIPDSGLSASELAHNVQSNNVDGLVFLGIRRGDTRFSELYRKKIPFIFIHHYEPGRNYPYVDTNAETGLREAMEYLKSNGLNKCMLVSGGNAFRNALDRTAIYKKLIKEYSFSDLGIIDGDFSIKSGVFAAKKIALEGLPEVIFCANDRIACGLIQGFQELQIRVPMDVKVIVFDDMNVTRIVTPKLTTIENPFFECGKKAAELILSCIKKEKPQNIILPSKLIIRDSA